MKDTKERIKKELEKIDNKEILLFIESMVIGYNDINKKKQLIKL